jgi:hypothetical protein
VRFPLTFEDLKSPDYKYIYASGVFGGLTPNDARMIFYLDRLEPETLQDPPGRSKVGKIIRELQVEVHVSPTQFKTMAQWMMRHIQRYESTFGEIPVGPRDENDDQPPSGLIA